MIDEVLIRQEAQKRGITASADEVENLLTKFEQLLPEWFPHTYGHSDRNCPADPFG